ncbi:hypothetical protein [Veronia pacifica]|uniref:Outer membrane protein beta-barrel domain-containing protein n=1 Tax=Veronia pacifica TaxID=1080227 RepID=A0A1C3EGU1_9GAMM|nr:hypothetical protein [Veronia pacifica]ODA32457.1 hypothetical protein A8L45_12740 [Veronia pacifica]
MRLQFWVAALPLLILLTLASKSGYALERDYSVVNNDPAADALKEPWISRDVHTLSPAYDSWTLVTEYHIPIVKQVNVYVATEMGLAASAQSSSRGLLSGIEYNFNESLIFKGQVQATKGAENTLGVIGMSTQYYLFDNLNLEAKLDYSLNDKSEDFALYQFGVDVKF